MYDVGKNFFGLIELHYLDVQSPREGETTRQYADRVGKAMADDLKVPYVPYTTKDIEYFGKNGPIEDCSPEYLKDYGWMGRLEDYRAMCARNGLDPRFEWPKERFVK